MALLFLLAFMGPLSIITQSSLFSNQKTSYALESFLIGPAVFIKTPIVFYVVALLWQYFLACFLLFIYRAIIDKFRKGPKS